MRTKNIILIFVILFFGIFSFSMVLPAYTETLNQGLYTGTPSTFSLSNLGFSSIQSFYDSSYCKQGNDFMLYVDTLGCTPAVVRSDLLEEQNVAVFCPISSIKLNPMLQVDSFKSVSVRFSRDYDSRYVVDVTFFPYKGALLTQTTSSLNSENPNQIYNNNIGYAVVYLRQNENESSMPDYVEVNLTANLKYNSKNILGLKGNVFYLPVLTDDDFRLSKDDYSFFEGKGYLRAEQIDSNKATISFYSYANNAPIQGDTSMPVKLFQDTLEKGETSSMIYLPSYGCNTGFQIKLDSLENPGTFVKLKINSEYIDVKPGETFLDGACYLKSNQDLLVNYGLVKQAVLNCKVLEPDSDGDFHRSTKDIVLLTSPKFNISINGVENSYAVGDLLKSYKENDKTTGIYLGYAGFDGKNLKLVLVSKEGIDNELSQDELNYFAGRIEDKSYSFGTTLFKGFKYGSSNYNYNILSFDKNDISFGGKGDIFSLKGYSEGADVVLDGYSDKYYGNAEEEFDTVINEYNGEKYPNTDTISLGQKALREKIILSKKLEQRTIALKLCNEYKKNYPQDYEFKECNNLNKNSASNEETIITGEEEQYTISLEDIYQPSFSEYGLELNIKNLTKNEVFSYQLSKDKLISLEDSTGDSNSYVVLSNIFDENNVALSIKIPDKEYKSGYYTSNRNLQKGKSVVLGNGNYEISIKKINLEKYAKISINSAQNYDRSNATFHFRIDIEKRNIKLSPDKIKEKITSLNKSIDQWSKISDNLGTVVKSLKTACLASDAVLTLKHLVSDSGGKGIARTQVMTGSGGWNERCVAMVENKKYKSVENCLYQNSGKIEDEVNAYSEQMSQQNSQIKDIQNDHLTDNALFGGKVVDTDGFVEEYSKKVAPGLTGTLTIKDPNDNTKTKTINLADYQSYLDYENYKQYRDYSAEDLRNIDLYKRMVDSPTNENIKEIYSEKLVNTLNKVKSNQESTIESLSLQKQYNGLVYSASLSKPKTTYEITGTSTFKDAKNSDLKICGSDCPGSCGTINIPDDTKVFIVQDKLGPQKYLFTLGEQNQIMATYQIVSNGCLGVYKGIQDKNNPTTDLYKEANPFGIEVNVVGKNSCTNTYLNAELKYYDTDPYKGMPALVPFDRNNGWYAYIKQTLPVLESSTASYEESGKATSFFICNVGKNGLEEFNSVSKDDLCIEINEGTGQPYNQIGCLSESEATTIVNKARSAIQTATVKGKNAKTGDKININGYDYYVGESAVNIPATQCTDFMSPKECQLLFNVCDPVICPSSRCDFGGAYPVKDVIQSGIIGSLVLCLPNWNQGVYIPVCLTGVKAGLDSWISVMQSYRGCLQDNLDTGKTIGICDEINSVYMCEFFWRQAFPIAKLAIPKILSALTGQNSRGGGEYKGVQAAWTNAQNSINYFVQNYALNSFNAFKYRSAEQIGSEVCNKFVSLSYPNDVNLLDEMTEPDSPAQFYGRFDEIPFTTATNPAISQYKVFYHIYSGTDRGSYYRVYLTEFADKSSSILQLQSGRLVASGYIERGGYKTETLDFTAPSGYKKLCINVNGDQECGFGQATTSFVSDYIKDQYIKQQATTNSVTTEKQCVSGTASLYSLLNLNIQEGINDLIDPQIYDQGVIRVCATENPGKTSDNNYGTDNQRWLEVGYCGDTTLKCWLDTQTLANAFNFETSYQKTMNKTISNYIENLYASPENQYYKPIEFDKAISQIDLDTLNINKNLESIKNVETIMSKTFFSNEIAYLHLMKGLIYGNLAKTYFASMQKERELQTLLENCDVQRIIDKKGIDYLKSRLNNIGIDTSTMDETQIKEYFKEKICDEMKVEFSSVWFEYYDGKKFFCFIYSNQQWNYFVGECPADENTVWISAKDKNSKEYTDLKTVQKDIVDSMASKKYKDGIIFLIKEVKDSDDNDATLLTQYARFEKSGLFSFEKDIVSYPQDIYIYYFGIDKGWEWSTENKIAQGTWTETPKLGDTPEQSKAIISDFENNKEIAEHYEQGIIAYLGNLKNNFEEGALYLLQGDFVLSKIKKEIQQPTPEEKVLSSEGPCAIILNIIGNLNGQSADKNIIGNLDEDKNVNCYDSMLYIYNQASDIEMHCVYTAGEEGNYIVVDKKGNVINLNDFGPGQRHSSTSKSSKACDNSGAIDEISKFNMLMPGCIISYASEYSDKNGPYAPHSAIFVSWTDSNKGLAELFDWNGQDSEGNKVFQYKENIDISDDSYPVYQIWCPVFKDTQYLGNKDSNCYEQGQGQILSTDIFSGVTESPKFRMESGGFSRDICFNYSTIWYWSADCDNVGIYTANQVTGEVTLKKDWMSVETTENIYGSSLKNADKLLVASLRDKSLKEGLQILLNEAKNRKDLIARSTSFSEPGIFYVKGEESRDDLYFFNSGANNGASTNWLYSLTDVTLSKYKSVNNIDTSVLSSKQINLIASIKGRDYLSGAKILFWYDYLSESETSSSISSASITNLEQAMYAIREMTGKYSATNANKNFIDELCNKGILNTNECNDIKGVGGFLWGVFNAENTMEEVKILLIAKEISKNNGKWNTISALLKTYLIKGSYIDNNDLIYNLYKDGVLEKIEYDKFVNEKPADVVTPLKAYLLSKYESEKVTLGDEDITGIIEKIQQLAKQKTHINNGYGENRSCASCTDSNNCIYYLSDAIKTYAEEQNVDSYLVLAVVLQESNCNQNAKNSDSGSAGLMQITSSTFNDICATPLDKNFVNDVFDIDTNIHCGVLVLKNKYNSFKKGVQQSSVYNSNSGFKKLVDNCISDYPKYETYTGWDAALRGYNGWGCVPPKADVNYVEKVDNLYQKIKNLASS